MPEYDDERQDILRETEQLAKQRLEQRKAKALAKANPKTFIRHKYEDLTESNVEALEDEVRKAPKGSKV